MVSHDGNSNIEEKPLTDWLRRQGHDDKLINRVLFELNKAAALGGSKTLYDANREVYGLLRYGVKVRPAIRCRSIVRRAGPCMTTSRGSSVSMI